MYEAFQNFFGKRLHTKQTGKSLRKSISQTY